MQYYSTVILEHFHHPRHVYGGDSTPYFIERGGVDQGAIVQFYADIDAQRIIQRLQFKAYGCVTTIACCSFVCELFTAKPVAAMAQLTVDFLLQSMQIAKLKQPAVVMVVAGVHDLVHEIESIL